MGELVSTSWLIKHLDDIDLVIFDCSWFLPNEKKDPLKNYKKNHIKGSHFFDIDKVSDKNNKSPHMVPKLKYFEKE